MKDKGITTAICTKEPNYIKSVCIFEPKSLYLIFWVAEDNPARELFKKAAETRANNIKNSKSYSENIDRIYLIPLYNFDELSKVVLDKINLHRGKEKCNVVEISIFSHSGGDGPIIYSSNNSYPLENYPNQMRLEGWNKICLFLGGKFKMYILWL